MCGICGFTGKLPDSKDVLTRMMDRIKHRGPDSAGQYITEKAAWGFRRLSIIDLDHYQRGILCTGTKKRNIMG